MCIMCLDVHVCMLLCVNDGDVSGVTGYKFCLSFQFQFCLPLPFCVFVFY